MPRIKKKTGLDTDSSIQDAVKRVKENKEKKKNMLDAAGASNEYDNIGKELDYGKEPENIRKIFES